MTEFVPKNPPNTPTRPAQTPWKEHLPWKEPPSALFAASENIMGSGFSPVRNAPNLGSCGRTAERSDNVLFFQGFCSLCGQKCCCSRDFALSAPKCRFSRDFALSAHKNAVFPWMLPSLDKPPLKIKSPDERTQHHYTATTPLHYTN